MILRLLCPSGHVLDVNSQLAGRKIRCGACGKIMTVPGPARKPVVKPAPRPPARTPEKPPAARPQTALPVKPQAPPPAIQAPEKGVDGPSSDTLDRDRLETYPTVTAPPPLEKEPPAPTDCCLAG